MTAGVSALFSPASSLIQHGTVTMSTVFPSVDTLSDSDQDAAPGPKAKAKAKAKSKGQTTTSPVSHKLKLPGTAGAKANPKKSTKPSSKPAAKKKPAAAALKRPAAAVVGETEEGNELGFSDDHDHGVAALKRPAAAVAGDAEGNDSGGDPGDNGDGAPTSSKSPKVSCVYLYKTTGKFAVKRNGKQIFQAPEEPIIVE